LEIAWRLRVAGGAPPFPGRVSREMDVNVPRL
jgi:hypothetical protein